jgi:protein arginine N-methyltransferase 1
VPGGTLIPRSIVQWAAPVTSDRFEQDLASWQRVGHGLDFSDAEYMSRNNMYVYAIEPRDLAAVPPAMWDALDFTGEIDSQRAGSVSWRLTTPATIYGFALWWDCTLAPGVVLSTSPAAPRTHWEQIYLPLLEPLTVAAADEIDLTVSSETGGNAGGIDVRWGVSQRRNGAVVSEQSLAIADGFLG